MTIWYVLYGAAAVFFWGLFVSVDENKESSGMNLIMALIWPVAVLAIAGYLIGHKPK